MYATCYFGSIISNMNNFLDVLKRNAAVLGVMGLGVLAVTSAVFLSRSTSTVPTGTRASEASCNISYVVAGVSIAPTPEPCIGSIDVNLVMDRSSSMNVNYTDPATGVTKKRLEWEKDAMLAFLQAARDLAQSEDNLTIKATVTSYGAQGNIPDGETLKLGSAYRSTLHTPALLDLRNINSYNSLVSAVTGVAYNPSGDGTCTECGLRIGRKQVFATRASTALVKANVLIADGLSNRVWDGTGYLEPTWKDEDPANPANQKAVSEAALGKGERIEHYVVGYGSGVNFNGRTLQSISNTGQSPYYTANPIPTDWASTMSKVLANLCEVSSERAGR